MSGKIWWLALLCGVAVALPASAQEGVGSDEPPAPAPPTTQAASKDAKLGEEPMHRWGAITISLAGWKPTKIGNDDELAVVLWPDKVPYPLTLGSTANIRETWLAAYHLPKDLGSIVVKYDSMNNSTKADFLSPGQFIYGESLAFPGFRGAFDDGLADGVSADGVWKTRDTRLQFADDAWETKRTRATWGAGYQTVSHNELLQVEYLALVPNLPPVIPPVIDPAPPPAAYAPRPDFVKEQTDYSGSGLNASLDVEFLLHPRFSIISGLSIGLLRGKTTTSYASVTSFYYSTDPVYRILSKDELFDILNNGTSTQIKAVGQDSVVAGLNVSDLSQMSQAYDLYFGFKSAVWRGLSVFLTLRETYYQNVGARIVLKPDLTIESQSLSVGYEGYVVGLSWRF